MRYVSHLACTVCGTTFSAETLMNLCPHDGRPIQMVMDLDRLKAERGRDGWWNPARRDLWRFGGTAASRYQRRDRFPLDRHPGRGMHTVAGVRSSSGRQRRVSISRSRTKGDIIAVSAPIPRFPSRIGGWR